LTNLPILTVSDQDGFLDNGGMIVLKNNGSRLQFGVDLRRVEKSGIKISSKMLQVANEVRED